MTPRFARDATLYHARLYDPAIQLSGIYVTILSLAYTPQMLAAAYAESGDFAGAVTWQRKAIELLAQAPDPNPSTNLAASREGHLRLYESGQPLRWCYILLNEDARVQLRWTKYEEAQRRWTKALDVVRSHLGESHPETRGCLLALVALYEAWGKPEEAEKWRAQLPPE
ncbi:MAG: tetratricopeptide repeat protein, partial [Planctomycetaceae bacterium]